MLPPQLQMVSSTGNSVIRYFDMEKRTHGGTVFSCRRIRMPSRTSSCKWRISIRSVISGKLRRSSLRSHSSLSYADQPPHDAAGVGSPAHASLSEHAKCDLPHRGRVAALTAAMLWFLVAVLG
jgi:hypothetical protein